MRGNYFFAGRMPNQRLVQRVYKAHYRGRDRMEIVRKLDVPVGNVYRWLDNPDWYYPWEDVVVLHRMTQGDPAAFQAATAWERRWLIDWAMGLPGGQARSLGRALGIDEALSRSVDKRRSRA